MRLAPRAARAARARGATCRSRARPRAAPPGPRRPWPAASGAAAARSPRRGRPAASGSAVCLASNRPSARPSPATRQTASGSAKPLRRCGPRSSSSNRPPTSRRVAWLITTLPGSASACRRAARFGVSPTTASSRAAPSPIRSPTTTCPVAMPDPGLQPASSAWGLQPSHVFDQLQPGAHRALGVVLVRLRPAEIGQHAVAQVLGDMAVEAADHLRAGRLIGAHDRAQVLGIEPRRQLGRADQIAEHHGQLPALGFARSRRRRRWLNRSLPGPAWTPRPAPLSP